MTANVAVRSLGFAVAVTLVLVAALGAMSRGEIEHVAVPLNVPHKIGLRLAELEAARLEEKRFDVAFLGDSTAGASGREGSIPGHLEAEANRVLVPGSENETLAAKAAAGAAALVSEPPKPAPGGAAPSG